MVEPSRDDATFDPRRNQQRRYSHPKSVECVLLMMLVGRRSGRWTDMIVETTVLVVQDDKQRRIPDELIPMQSVIDTCKKPLRSHG